MSALLTLCNPTPAAAQSIVLDFSGTLTDLTYSDCQAQSPYGGCGAWSFTSLSSSDFLDGLTVAQGDTFHARLVYDTAAPLSGMSSDGFQAVYLHAVTSSEFRAGAVALPAAALPLVEGSYSVVDGRNGYDSFFLTTAYSGETWFSTLTLDLLDSTGTLYSGFGAPQTVALPSFTASLFDVGLLRRSDGDQLHLRGTVSSLSAAPVPEPGSLALGLAGLVTFLFVARPARVRKGGASGNPGCRLSFSP